MKTGNMKSKRFKILVLSDMKDATTNTLKSAVDLAKIIGGDLYFFHVKKPTEIVEQESQLSAIRTINEFHTNTTAEIKKLLNPISKEFGIKIIPSHAFGNVKNEIDAFINESQPDIIVLGKRKSKSLNLMGDNVTDFVSKKHEGMIMISADENRLDLSKELALGILNEPNKPFNMEFANSLAAHSKKPLKLFKVGKKVNEVTNAEVLTDSKLVEFVFEESDNVINNLSKYLLKSNIDVLCLNRDLKSGKINIGASKTGVRDLSSKITNSLLISRS